MKKQNLFLRRSFIRFAVFFVTSFLFLIFSHSAFAASLYGKYDLDGSVYSGVDSSGNQTDYPAGGTSPNIYWGTPPAYTVASGAIPTIFQMVRNSGNSCSNIISHNGGNGISFGTTSPNTDFIGNLNFISDTTDSSGNNICTYGLEPVSIGGFTYNFIPAGTEISSINVNSQWGSGGDISTSFKGSVLNGHWNNVISDQVGGFAFQFCDSDGCTIPFGSSAPAASCFDRIQNQDETGIDTGGVCSHSSPIISTPFYTCSGTRACFNLDLTNTPYSSGYDMGYYFQNTSTFDPTMTDSVFNGGSSVGSATWPLQIVPNDYYHGSPYPYYVYVFKTYDGISFLPPATDYIMFHWNTSTGTWDFYSTSISPGTCSDGTKNQNETGIDTGGVCSGATFTGDIYQTVVSNHSTEYGGGWMFPAFFPHTCPTDATCSNGVPKSVRVWINSAEASAMTSDAGNSYRIFLKDFGMLNPSMWGSPRGIYSAWKNSSDIVTGYNVFDFSSNTTETFMSSWGTDLSYNGDMQIYFEDNLSHSNFTSVGGDSNTPFPYFDVGISSSPSVVLSSEKAITAFNFQGLAPNVTGVVNETNHTINLTVPFGTDVSALVPTITISSGASVSPNTNIAQNFSSPVIYTVTAADGSTQEYIVTVVPSCTADCFSSVLFLPGIEASRLYKSETVGDLTAEYKFWEPSSNSDVENLYLNTDGTSVDPSIYTRDIINTENVMSVSGSDVYKSLITELNNLKSTNKISDWKPYAYDWRQGINDLIQNGTKYNDGQTLTLIGMLQSLVNTSKTGKVTIITHSNGGLLAKALIKKLEDMKSAGQSDLVDHIDNLVMVAAPQLGTPEALSGILHGYNESLGYGWLMDEIHARKLAQNMASAYGLLPSQKYFDLPGISYPAVFNQSEQIYTTAYGPSISSYQEEHNFVLGQEGRTQPADSDLISPTIGNSTLLTQAENLHDSIDNMTFPSSINVISIAGWGRATISGMTYLDGDIQPITTIRGDETVVSQSASYGQGTKYWLDLSQSTLNHGHIFEDPQLLSFIDNIIEQKSSTLSNITDTEPLQSGILLAQSVHSPVSIGVYDTQGNFTGKVCDESTGNCVVKENIPGSTYLEFGEGKYINVSQNKVQKTVLQGTDIGTFTFNSQTLAPGGQTTTSSFVNIPVTTQTQAEITLNQNTGAPQLALDVTGDGVSDFTISPSANFDPVTYLQIMKATINSLDLTQVKINAFDKRVDNIIKLIQKGKINKAELKADKFKSVLENKLAKPDPKHVKPKKLSKTDAQLLLDMLNKLLDNLN